MRILLLTAALLTGLGRVSPANAFPNYAALYKSAYSYLPNCSACHDADSWENNKFGKDFGGHGRDLKALRDIGAMDSDGDGFPNAAEIAARSDPGNPRSVPARPGPWLKDAAIRAPGKFLKEAFKGTDLFKVLEFELDQPRLKALSGRWGAPLPDESRLSVLFSAHKGTTLAGFGAYLSLDLPGRAEPSLFFIGADSKNKLVFLKLIRYSGTRSLSKSKAWDGLLGKGAPELLADRSEAAPAAETLAVRRALARGLLVIEAFQEKN